MSPKRLFPSLLFVIFLIPTLLWIYRQSSTPKTHAFQVSHYRQSDIQAGVSHFPPLTIDPRVKVVRGGVVSHHLLATDAIAHYFENLSQSSYDRVIIIGPNHGELGNNHLVTSSELWDTPYGKVFADSLVVADITKDGGATLDDFVLSSDHAIEVLIPFVRIFLPESKVVPLMVSANTTPEEINQIVNTLKKYSDQQTLYLVSSDFSHYLLPSVASKKDEETLTLIKSFQVDRIRRLGNDHLDSPASLVILMRLMQESATTSLIVYDHTDASKIANTPYSPTTSYYFLNYYENVTSK